MGRKPTFKIEEALELFGQGLAVKDVAAALGVTPSAITQRLKNHGFKNPYSHILYARVKKAHDLRKQGHSVEFIAHKLGVTELCARKYLAVKNVEGIKESGAYVRGQSVYDKIMTLDV